MAKQPHAPGDDTLDLEEWLDRDALMRRLTGMPVEKEKDDGEAN